MPDDPFPPPLWIILGAVIVCGLLAILVPMLVHTGERPPDKTWKGIFYSNPDDPSLLVPKRFGIGYTLNFGNPWSWAVLALIVLMAVLPFILTGILLRPFLKLAAPR